MSIITTKQLTLATIFGTVSHQNQMMNTHSPLRAILGPNFCNAPPYFNV